MNRSYRGLAMKVEKSRGILVAVFLLVLLVSGLRAQTAGATINGTVTDETGAVVPGATVTASSIETGQSSSAVSDQAGRYTILDLSAGHYDIKATRQGFTTVERNNQELLVGTTITMDFPLHVSTVQETVEVEAVAPELQATQNTLSTVLETHQLDNLPILDRNFAEMAALVPGVQVTPASTTAGSTASLTIGNGTTYQTGWTIDGIPVYRTFDHGVYINYAQDWIQEYSVMTQQFPAEYGDVATGLVNALVRSGTNQIHGRAYGFGQDAALNATPPFFKPSTLQPSKPAYNQERLGGLVGGPIKRDRLFYFGGFEYYRQSSSAIVNPMPAAFVGSFQTLPSSVDPGDSTSGAAIPFLSTSRLGMAKVDYQIGQKHSFEFAANIERDHTNNNGVGGTTTLGAGGPSITKAYSYWASWRWIISPTGINDFKIYDAKNDPETACNYAAKVGTFPTTGVTPNPQYGFTPFGNPTGWWTQLVYPGAPGDSNLTLGCQLDYGLNGTGVTPAVYDTMTRLRGNHEIKFGLQGNNAYFQSANLHNGTDGQYSFPGSQTIPFNASNSATFPIQYVLQFQPNIAKTDWTQKGWTWGAFIEDNWKITDKLTLNMGLRYDLDFTDGQFNNDFIFANPAQMALGHTPLHPDNRDVAPRFGYAWTPFVNRNTVFRGGIGVFYDADLGTTKDTYISNVGVVAQGYNLNANSPTLNPYCASSTPCSGSVPATDQQALEAVLAYALVNYTIPDFAPPGGTVTVGGSTYTIPTFSGSAFAPSSTYNIDQNLKADGTIQGTGGLQHLFADGLTISADYVMVHGFNDIIVRNVNINPTSQYSGKISLVNPNFSSVFAWGNGGYFNSNSIRAQASYRDHRSDFLQAAYTFGIAKGNSPASFSMHSKQIEATDPFNYAVDYGPTGNDQRNTIVLSGQVNTVWGIHWEPIFSDSSALPFTATTTQGPGTIPNCPIYYNQCYPTGYSRASLRGDSTISFSSRLDKVVKLGENKSITAFLEGYNIPNHLNLGTNFVTNVLSASFRKPSGTAATPGRQLQIGARFDF
jgi:hypothetical protein